MIKYGNETELRNILNKVEVLQNRFQTSEIKY